MYGCAATAFAICVSGTAWAQGTQLQPTTPMPPPGTYVPVSDVAPAGVVDAPMQAFELGLTMGYTQPLGQFSALRGVESIVGPGFAPGLNLAYRISPHVSLGIAGEYHESQANDGLPTGSHVRGVSVNLNGSYHFMPYNFIDPYVQLGTGYRGIWEVPSGAPNRDQQGFQIARLQLGADYRVSKDVALGPYVAADLNVFAWDHIDGSNTQSINNTKANTFLSAGLMGRFDMGGARATPGPVAIVQPVYFEAAAPLPTPPATVVIQPEILEACGVEDKKAFFDFDKSDLTANDQTILGQVVSCLTTGALKGREIVVVGRADPRGSDKYNKKLGQSRADTVQEYLVNHGVKTGEVQTISRGKEDAQGTDEATWAYDRRVDIQLK